MRKPFVYAIVLALVVAAVGGGLLSKADAEATEKPKVLIVYLNKIIDQSDEGRAVVGKLRAEIAAKKTQIEREVVLLQEKQKQLQNAKLDDRTPEWYAEFEAAMVKYLELKKDEQLFAAKLGDKLARKMLDLIALAKQEAQTIMRARGADMVIISKMGPFEINNDRDVINERTFRRVLCAKKELDVTDEVIKAMNAWYKANNKKGKG